MKKRIIDKRLVFVAIVLVITCVATLAAQRSAYEQATLAELSPVSEKGVTTPEAPKLLKPVQTPTSEVMDGLGVRTATHSELDLKEQASEILLRHDAAQDEIIYADFIDIFGKRWVGLFKHSDQSGATLVEIVVAPEGGCEIVEIKFNKQLIEGLVNKE